MSKTVFLTGATGFIGRHAIAPLVKRGFDVHLAVRNTELPFEMNDAVHVHECDLFDPRRVQSLLTEISPTHLLHFAWYTEHRKYWTSVKNLEWTAASLELLKSFAACGGRRAVFAGTCAEYDWSYGYCSETVTPCVPRTLYGVCKNSLQQIVSQYSQTAGLSSAWGRIFFLYGPDEAAGRFVPSLVQPLLENRAAQCQFGAHLRDFLHVTDVASAFVQLLDSEVAGPINIASGVPVSLGDFAKRIAAKLGKAEFLQVEARPPSPENPAVLFADATRLRNEVRFCPRYDIDTGLDQVLENSLNSLSER